MQKNKICTRGEWSGITAEMEEQVSNALFTTCIAMATEHLLKAYSLYALYALFKCIIYHMQCKRSFNLTYQKFKLCLIMESTKYWRRNSSRRSKPDQFKCFLCKKYIFLPKLSTYIKGESIGIAAEIEGSGRQRFSDRARPIVDFATLTSYRGSLKF